MNVDLRARFLGHSSVLVELDGTRVLTDPVLRDRVGLLRRHSVPVAATHLGPVDVVVISHLHHDHCDLPTLRALGPDVAVVAPRGAGAWLRSKGISQAVELGEGEQRGFGTVTVTGVHADHDGRRVPTGPSAQALGYLVAGGGSGRPMRRVYFAGDTALFAAMAELADGPGVDLALLPVWGWGPNLGPGHMDPRQAAEAARLIRPSRAMPVHWGSLLPLGARRWLQDRLVDPPHAFAEAAGRRAPRTRVDVVEPGGWMV